MAQLGREALSEVWFVDGNAQLVELLRAELLTLPLAELVALGRAADDQRKRLVVATSHAVELICVLLDAMHESDTFTC